jgi:hypothetical protein
MCTYLNMLFYGDFFMYKISVGQKLAKYYYINTL